MLTFAKQNDDKTNKKLQNVWIQEVGLFEKQKNKKKMRFKKV